MAHNVSSYRNYHVWKLVSESGRGSLGGRCAKGPLATRKDMSLKVMSLISEASKVFLVLRQLCWIGGPPSIVDPGQSDTIR